MMVEDKCGAKTWSLVDGKWKEHVCRKTRGHNMIIAPKLVSANPRLGFHECPVPCGYEWKDDDSNATPWKKNLPSHEDVLKQMQDLIGI